MFKGFILVGMVFLSLQNWGFRKTLFYVRTEKRIEIVVNEVCKVQQTQIEGTERFEREKNLTVSVFLYKLEEGFAPIPHDGGYTSLTF